MSAATTDLLITALKGCPQGLPDAVPDHNRIQLEVMGYVRSHD